MNLPLPVAVAIMALVAAALLAIMWFGWRGRVRRSAPLVPSLPEAPTDPGAARTEPIDAVYVSSTTAGDWLDRVAAQDLGFRSQAVVQVFDAGIMIGREGAQDVFVPAASLTGASTAPGMAGKFVGKDGLVVVTWTPGGAVGTGAGAAGGTTLDTGLRTKHAADRPVLLDAARSLLTGAASTTEETQ
jgi:hypothetical protein